MTSKSNPFVYIPGSGGGAPDLTALQSASDAIAFEVIKYPDWRRYIDPKYSAEMLISELSAEIEKRIPGGPLRIVGLSLGGHFAYLIALHLQDRGRQIDAVCAIDSFIVSTDQATPGWQRRAFAEFFESLRKFRLTEMVLFGRSRIWRAMLRMIGGKLPLVLSGVSRFSWLSNLLEDNTVLKQELAMRMLMRLVAPWLATIDDNPRSLAVPVALVRTESTASSDSAWRARCPNLRIFEVQGLHHTLFDPENGGALRDAFFVATQAHRTSNA
jgi:thioesterase domain-containing protein